MQDWSGHQLPLPMLHVFVSTLIELTRSMARVRRVYVNVSLVLYSGRAFYLWQPSPEC
jgi:hypothetical protein